MKILLFGATGSAGGSVFRVCLETPAVEEVRVIVRRPLDLAHGRLRMFVHGNYLDFAAVEEAFANVDACLYCLGISATQVSVEKEYRVITHDFALAAAHALKAHSPGAAFHFVSGQGTSLDSRMMWARVKAETERDLKEVVDTVCWRPAFIDGETSQSAPWILQATRPLFRLLSPLRSLYVSGKDLGRAMVQAASENVRGRTIENREIRKIADRT
ncbi:MAG: hypothetical protein QOH06_864 [Acidobacteriota bacterium]|jgi:uncharacterized protein YbjT (DUF2867 family)|nr:hypothetical protein [Acidobacteriota bacterium]